MVSDDVRQVITFYRRSDEHDCTADFESFADHWEGEVADSTLVQYVRYLANVDFEITEENVKAFEEWVKQRSRERFGTDEDDRNTRIRWRYLTYLAFKRYLKSAGRREWLHYLPDSDEMKKPSFDPQTTRYSEDEVQTMLNASSDEQIRLTLVLLYYAGMRSIEVVNCTAEWFSFKDDRIEIEIPSKWAKGRRSDPAPEYAFLPGRFEDDLKKYIARFHDHDGSYRDLYEQLVDGDGFQQLFSFTDGTGSLQDLWRERYYLRKALERTAKRAGISKADKISAHCLRRSFIKHVYDNTNDLKRTSLLSRHADTSVTDKHYLQMEKQEQIDTYNEVFA